MDAKEAASVLERGAKMMKLDLPRIAIEKLLLLERELLRWNRKTNLTGLTDPEAIFDRHFFDSLAVAPEVSSAGELLDVGAGAGFPGIPIKIVCPTIRLTLVDSNQKRVAFMRHALEVLDLTSGSSVLCARASGQPEAEGVPMMAAVVSRAMAPLPIWVALGRSYLSPGGRLLAMVSESVKEEVVEELAQQYAMTVSVKRYQLPLSGARRSVAVFHA